MPIPCPAKDFAEPPLHKVVTKIVVDDPMFIPQYKTEGAACVDLVANIPDGEIRLVHRATVKIDCGFSMQLKPGWKANIRAKPILASVGLALMAINDEDRCCVLVTNVGNVNPITLRHGEVIAQMSIDPIYCFEWDVVNSL